MVGCYDLKSVSSLRAILLKRKLPLRAILSYTQFSCSWNWSTVKYLPLPHVSGFILLYLTSIWLPSAVSTRSLFPYVFVFIIWQFLHPFVFNLYSIYFVFLWACVFAMFIYSFLFVLLSVFHLFVCHRGMCFANVCLDICLSVHPVPIFCCLLLVPSPHLSSAPPTCDIWRGCSVGEQKVVRRNIIGITE